MKYNPDIHHRRSIRLKEYDYSQAGAYFVTICVHDRECLFGEIVEMTGEHQHQGECRKPGECHSPLREMVVNDLGRIVAAEWIRSAEIRSEIELGEFVVMPNHFHGIVNITTQPVGAYGHTPVHHMPVRSPSKTIGAMVRGFKSAVTKFVNEARNSPGVPLWQRNYYEHVIRDDADYNRIAEYVIANPQRWIEDKLHPDNIVVAENVVKRTNIVGNANIVGAIHELPLRNVPPLGGRNE